MTANVLNFIEQTDSNDNKYHFEGTVYFGNEVFSGEVIGRVLQANKITEVDYNSPLGITPNGIVFFDSSLFAGFANTLTVPSLFSKILMQHTVGAPNPVTITGSEGAQFVDASGIYTIMTFNVADSSIELVPFGTSATDWRVIYNNGVVLS